VNRPQEVAEGPVRYARPVPPRYYVCGTKVDSLVDSDVGHIVSHIRKAVTGFCLFDKGAHHFESHFVAKEALERSGHTIRQVSAASLVFT